MRCILSLFCVRYSEAGARRLTCLLPLFFFSFGLTKVENQRIATYNRIVHELQQSIMTQSQQEKTQGHSTPPVDITTTTFIQPVLMGSREPRRHTIRLTITSAIDIDWSAGWSGKQLALFVIVDLEEGGARFQKQHQ